MTLLIPPKRARGHGKPFVKGYDPRRHVLTLEERRRGGRTSWNRFMAIWRGEMGLAFPFDAPLWAKQLYEARFTKTRVPSDNALSLASSTNTEEIPA